VLSPSDLSILRTFPLTYYYSSAYLDVSNSRIFFAGQGFSSSIAVSSFEIASAQQLGSISMTQESGYQFLSLSHFGSNGLSIVNSSAILFLKTSLAGGAIPAPTISSISPSTIPAGSTDTTVTINGANFTADASVKFAGVTVASSFVSSTRLTAVVSATLVTQAGTKTVTVTVPGAVSATANVQVTPSPILAVSASSHDFGNVNVGAASSGSVVTLSNSGSASLTITAISISGDFQQTNTCGNQLSANGSCVVSITFAPSAGGTRSGTLTVAHDAAGSPAEVALSGTGSEFQIVAGSGGTTPAQTVKSGTPATFNLAFQNLGNFNGAVTFACSNAPTNGSCVVSPSSLPAGSTNTTVTVTVNTSTVRAASLRHHSAFLAFASLLPMILVMPARKVLRRWSVVLIVLLIVSIAVLSSCGGGGGGASPTPNPTTSLTPAGSYDVLVTASSGAMTRQMTLHVVVQ
jgi:hypothetical protein